MSNRRLRLLALVFAALVSQWLWPAEVQAQVTFAPPQTPSPSVAAPFTWAEVPTNAPLHFFDATPAAGWMLLYNGVKVRFVPGFANDPTVEVLLDAPLSGHPTKPEIFLLQFPSKASQIPVRNREIVVAFRGSGFSHKSPFSASLLPEQCARREWLLVSPFGLVESHFANVPSQLAVDAVLAAVQAVMPFNRERVFTVGFSMGGMSALSYAMRRQDPTGLRVAGVVCHTGTIDVIQDYGMASLSFQQLLSDADHFAGTPTGNPFAWKRVNPARMGAGDIVNPAEAPVINLVDVPIYIHFDPADPTTNLVPQNQALYQYLLAQGGQVQLAQVAGGGAHKWSSLDEEAALDFLAGKKAPGPVPSSSVLEVFADLEQRYRFTEVLDLSPNVLGRFKVVSQAPVINACAVQGIVGVRDLALDLPLMQISANAPISLTTWSNDGAATTLRLRGLPAAPSSITVNGAPPVFWSHDAAQAELTVTPTLTGTFAVVQIYP
jgi:pimeloyl-ACP methyl ester carboxylesterase